jgi:hypothetical protein
MPETELERLFARFRKIEALFARAGTAGERDAAENALERIRARMRELERVEQPVELRFSLPDAWARELFVALLRRYGLRPYRYRNQRRTTVMVKVTKSFAEETLWPEFRELHATLREHLDAATRRIIAEAIHRDSRDAEEQPGDGGD